MFVGGGSSLLAVVLGAGAASAAPQPLTVGMEFVAPAGCSSADAFERAVESRTTRVRLTNAHEHLRLQVRLIRTPTTGRVRGELSISDDTGQSDTRDVEGDACSEVVEVLALTAVLALERWTDSAGDPGDASSGSTLDSGDNRDRSGSGAASAHDRATKDKPSGSDETTKPTTSDRDARKSAVADDTAAPLAHPEIAAPHFTLRAAAHAVFAELVVPELSSGGEFGVRLHEQRSSASLGVAVSYLTNTLLDSRPLRVRWLSGTVSACPLSREVVPTLSLEPCALVTYGWLWVRHRAVESPHTASRPWWSLGAALRGRLQLAQAVELELEFGATAPLARRRFTLDPQGPVWQSALVAPVAKVGLVLRF